MDSGDQDILIWHDHEAECHGCAIYGPVADVGLCADCAQKLERDLLRQCAWDYSHAAHVLGEQQREELRKKVIARYGSQTELIADEPAGKKKGKPPRRRRRKSRSK